MALRAAQSKSSIIVIGNRICKLFLVRYFRRGVVFMPTEPTDWQKKNQDILKEAFNQAQQEKREKNAQKAIEDRRAAGSQMVKKQSLSPNGPTPPRSTRQQVARETYDQDFTAEKAKEREQIRKAQAQIDDAKKRAAATAAVRPTKSVHNDAGQVKQAQQKQAATNHKMYAEIDKAKAEITNRQPKVMVKSDFNKSSGGREGR